MPYITPMAISPVVKADIDKNTTFCLACFSSLPPKQLKRTNSSTSSSSQIFITPCCQRLICTTCIAMNPRLLRYDPCLACLGGVGVVSSSPSILATDRKKMNVDGAVKDEDVFVLGDEDEDDSGNDKDVPAPPYEAAMDVSHATNDAQRSASHVITEMQEQNGSAQATNDIHPSPLKYYINRSDNLLGICLRYGLDGHELCRLNNLPPSTLTTTPHLLHTRRFIILPSSVRNAGVPINNETAEEQKAREVKWGKERAERRLQTLTKELDWRVAKAYVALADDPVEESEWERKMKEMPGTTTGMGPSNLEDRAIRRYLDDKEWEEDQMRDGKGSQWWKLGR